MFKHTYKTLVALAATAGFTAMAQVAEVPFTLHHVGDNPVGSVVSNSPGHITLYAGGNDIWSGADDFTFLYLQVTGDFDIKLRIESMEVTARWPKAGLMARHTLERESRMAFSKITPQGQIVDNDGNPTSNCGQSFGVGDVSMMYRTWRAGEGGNGGEHEDRIVPGDNNHPTYQWVRLQRVGSVFRAYGSTNGVTWVGPQTQDSYNWPSTIGGTDNDPFPGTIYVGIAGSRHGCAGETGNATATTQIRDNPEDPVIFTVQPQPVSVVTPGNSTTLRAVAMGWPVYLTYQWRLNGADIPDATNTTYTYTAPAASDTTNVLTCVASNSYNSTVAVSANAEVRATKGPRIAAVSNPGFGRLYIDFNKPLKNDVTVDAAIALIPEYCYLYSNAPPDGVLVVGPTGMTPPAVFTSVSLVNNRTRVILDYANHNLAIGHPYFIELDATVGVDLVDDDGNSMFANADWNDLRSPVFTRTVGQIQATSAAGNVGLRGILVKFNQALGAIRTQAENTANYTVNNGVTVVSATLLPNDTDVLLYTSLQDPVTGHTVTVQNIGDISPTPLAFTTPISIPGYVLSKRYDADRSIPDLKTYAAGNPPNAANLVPWLEYPDDGRDYFGAIITGWVVPAASGTYRFYTASDDENEFWLSPDENPANKVLVAEQGGWTGFRNYGKFQGGDGGADARARSNPIQLYRGMAYAAEGVFRDGTGGGHVSVGFNTGDDLPTGPVSGSQIAYGGPPNAGPTTLAVSQQPQNVTQYAGLRATFTVTMTGANPAGPIVYQWQSGGAGAWTNIPNANSASYETPVLAVADSGKQYRCVGVNMGGSLAQALSAPATLTVLEDTIAPTLVSAEAWQGFRKVRVVFSEPVEPVTAENPANYTLNLGVTVLSATRTGDGSVVILETSPQDIATQYTLTVNNVDDFSPLSGAIAPNSTANFYSYMLLPDKVKEEMWWGIGGGGINDLKNNSRYQANTPDRVLYVGAFDTADGGGDLFDYGRRMTGFIMPPSNGVYRLYTASDDDSEVWLSTDDNPANKALVASLTGWCQQRAYDVWQTARGGGPYPSARSEPIALEGGKLYYMEVLQKEGGGGDYVSVIMSPDGTEPVNGAFGMSGWAALPRSAGATTVTITTQPVSTTGYENGKTTFTCVGQGSNPSEVGYQWQVLVGGQWQMIIGANASTYQTPTLTLADNGTQYRCLVYNPGGTFAQAVSAVATLTVEQDLIPPTVELVTATPVPDRIYVRFSEVVPYGTESQSAYALSDGVNTFYPTEVVEMGNGAGFLLIFNGLYITNTTLYSLTVENVYDQGFNAIDPTPVQFQGWYNVPGRVQRQIFTGNSGANSFATITNNVKFPLFPDVVSFQDAANSQKNYGDSYSIRMIGWFIPPETATYNIRAEADDSAWLLMSTSPVNPVHPANAATVIRLEGGCAACNEPGNWSGPVNLVGGVPYYFQVLMQEGDGGDYLSVSFRNNANYQTAPGLFRDTDNRGNMTNGLIAWALVPEYKVISRQPTNIVVQDSFTGTLVCAAHPYAQPATYQWQRHDGAEWQNVAGATSHTYSKQMRPSTDNGAQYRCLVTLIDGTVLTSDTATVTVPGDNTPPAVTYITGAQNYQQIMVKFSERMNAASVGSGTYTLTDDLSVVVPVLGATLMADATTVLLTTLPQEPGMRYTLAFAGVTDDSENANEVTPNTAVFTNAVFADGIYLRRFDSIGGGTIPNLTNHVNFPNNPSFRTILGDMNYRPNIDNYGAWMSGIFIPPTTGNYKFWTRNDDDAMSFLSTDITRDNRQWVQARPCCNDGWDNNGNNRPNTEAVKSLVAGFPYYFESMVKEGGGGDYLEVGYTTGANVLNGGSAVRVPRTMMYQYGYINPAINITAQPLTQTTNVGATVTLSVAVDPAGSPFYTLYQWQRNGVNIPGARNASYTTPALNFLDNGVQYRCLVVRSDGARVSAAAVITVVPNETNPLVLQRAHSLNGQVVGLVFDDAVAMGTATNPAQYTITTASPIGWRPVTGAGDVVAGVNGSWPAGEHPGLTVDGLYRTKYLNFGKLNTGFSVQLGAGAKVVKAVRFTAANDAPERDPADFQLEGSNDGSSWTVITNSPLAAFQSRGWQQTVEVPNDTAYSFYRVMVPNVANAGAANSMQIAEVELLERPATVVVSAIRLNVLDTNVLQLTLSAPVLGAFDIAVAGVADVNGNYMAPTTVPCVTRGLKHINSMMMVNGDANNPNANWPGTYGWNVMGDENTIQAVVSGSDIWGGRDDMNFTYREISGDFEATVRIISLRNAGNWTKAGLMARPGLAAHERQRAVLATPAYDIGLARGENAVQMTARDGVGGGSSEILRTYPTGGRTDFPPLPYPNVWLKLVRSNGNFYAYHSLDGTTWVANGAYTDGLPALLNVGMASSAVNNSDYTRATYQDFQVKLIVPVPSTLTVDAIDEDSMATINLPGGGGSRTYEIVSGPAYGQLIVQGGTILYIPNPNFNGLDTFTYRAIDNGIASDVFSINIPVTMVEDAATRPYTFTNNVPITIGAPPRAVVTADFVKDNRLDLAVAIPASNVVAIFAGNGKGEFTNRFDLQVGNNPIALALGDFNYDRRPDLAVLCAGDRTVQIWQNMGVNVISNAMVLVTNIALQGNNPVALIAADVNKDLFVDLAVVDAGDGVNPGTVETFLHQRLVYAPVFDVTNVTQVGRSPSAISAGLLGTPTASDKPDLVVANSGDDTISILSLVGVNTMMVITNYPVGTTPMAVGVIDINGDKLPDILVANMGSDDLTVLTNASNPKVKNDMRFAPAHSFGMGVAMGFEPRDLGFGDFNNDKFVDVAIALMGADAVLVMHGNGLKSVTNNPPLPVLNFYYGDPGMFAAVEDMPVSLAVGDFNADRLPDVAVANWGSENVSILLNNWTPKAYNQRLVFVEDTPTNITLHGSYGPLDYYITVWPTNGVLNPSNSAGYLSLTDSPVLEYTPLTNRYGRDLIRYYVSDGVKTSKWANINITILPVNDQPVIATAVGEMGTLEVPEDVQVRYTNFITYAWAGPWGEEKQRLTYFFKPDAPWLFKGRAGLPRIATTNLTLFFMPSNNLFGETLVELWAKDSGRMKTNNPDLRPYGEQDTTVTQVFIVRITNVNDAPVFTRPAQLAARSIIEDTGTNWVFEVRDIDSDLDSLTVSLVSTNTALVDPANPAHWSYTKAPIPGTNTWEVRLNVTPEPNAYGRTLLTVVLSDGTNTSSRSMGLIVQPVNDAPDFVLTQTTLEVNSVSGHWSTNAIVDIAASIPLLGPANEVAPPPPVLPQRFLSFKVTPSVTAPFVSAPVINATTGGLVIRTRPSNVYQEVTLNIMATDSGGTLYGGVNTSAVKTVTLRINPQLAP